MSDYTIRSGDRAAFLAGLRELTDFLTANPTVLAPRRPSFAVFVDADDSAARRAGVESVASALGAPVADIGMGYFDVRREFGPISYVVIGVPPEERQ
ncbi:hypothetical protein [Streptomyces sp. NPDC090994]|uniref:hypothetical protein n=1 Tax=Streptomyces sp. NPDC090994 TaxID=3365969 RepID=UPI0037F2D317